MFLASSISVAPAPATIFFARIADATFPSASSIARATSSTMCSVVALTRIVTAPGFYILE